MTYQFFSRNGTILPTEQAVVSLANIEYSYGYGVYETIRVVSGRSQFLDQHIGRLMESARLISLEHSFTLTQVKQSVIDLIKANEASSCNIKILLIGGATASDANLYLQCLNPRFVDRKLYKTGVSCITYQYERPFPQAKTLNMLPSYLAYRQAQAAGAFDALLVNRDGNITEGSRTNFFVVKDRTIISPPEDQILLGVMRDNVLRVAKQNGYKIEQRDIPVDSLDQFDGAFLTNALVKILPIRSVDDYRWVEIPIAIKELMAAFKGA